MMSILLAVYKTTYSKRRNASLTQFFTVTAGLYLEGIIHLDIFTLDARSITLPFRDAKSFSLNTEVNIMDTCRIFTT